MQRVLVTDGEQRAALAVVRSLGRAGYDVSVCSARRRPLAGTSRYATAAALVPDPLLRPGDFVDEVARLAARGRVNLLVPVADVSVAALLPWRERFRPGVIPYPATQSYERISDKARVLEAAAGLGIAIPASTLLAAPPGGAANLPGSLSFPVAIKPTRSLAGAANGTGRVPVRYARDATELAVHLAALPPDAYPLLLQQRIVGPGVGIFLLLWRGELLASFAHRRLREKPPSGGVSVLCQSVAADPGLLERSRALLDHFAWDGVAMVEYKVDLACGTPYLMEVNGRFWGSLQLATDAGVDFPALLAGAALGRPVPPPSGYRVGVRSRWWWGSVDHLIACARRGAAPQGSGGLAFRARALLDALNVLRPGVRSDVLKPYDPMPFLTETVDWFARR